MGLLAGEKRKNDAPRRFQWWLLVIGFVLGVLVTLVAVPSYTRTVTVFSNSSQDDALFLTATAIIDSVTATAQALTAIDSNSSVPLDPLAAAATAIVEQATAVP